MFFPGCLSWHCRVEPKVGDRIPVMEYKKPEHDFMTSRLESWIMKYDNLMPEDIEPYLDGRSWKDLKVGDEIVFPEPITLMAKMTAFYEGTGSEFGMGDHFIGAKDPNGKFYVPDIPATCAKYKGNEPEMFMLLAAKYPAHAHLLAQVNRGVCIIRELRES